MSLERVTNPSHHEWRSRRRVDARAREATALREGLQKLVQWEVAQLRKEMNMKLEMYNNEMQVAFEQKGNMEIQRQLVATIEQKASETQKASMDKLLELETAQKASTDILRELKASIKQKVSPNKLKELQASILESSRQRAEDNRRHKQDMDAVYEELHQKVHEKNDGSAVKATYKLTKNTHAAKSISKGQGENMDDVKNGTDDFHELFDRLDSRVDSLGEEFCEFQGNTQRLGQQLKERVHAVEQRVLESASTSSLKNAKQNLEEASASLSEEFKEEAGSEEDEESEEEESGEEEESEESEDEESEETTSLEPADRGGAAAGPRVDAVGPPVDPGVRARADRWAKIASAKNTESEVRDFLERMANCANDSGDAEAIEAHWESARLALSFLGWTERRKGVKFDLR